MPGAIQREIKTTPGTQPAPDDVTEAWRDWILKVSWNDEKESYKSLFPMAYDKHRKDFADMRHKYGDVETVRSVNDLLTSKSKTLFLTKDYTKSENKPSFSHEKPNRNKTTTTFFTMKDPT